jgi:hypothetical protein
MEVGLEFHGWNRIPEELDAFLKRRESLAPQAIA